MNRVQVVDGRLLNLMHLLLFYVKENPMPNQTSITGQAIVNTNLYVGLVEQNAEMDRLRMQARLANSSSSISSSDEVRSLKAQIKRLKEEANTSNKVCRELVAAAVAEKDALITEWMHSNEAFKRLARQYGKKLGMSDEQRTQDFREQLVDIAEEDPKYAKTDVGIKAKTNLGK